jgi:hypothetical protein
MHRVKILFIFLFFKIIKLIRFNGQPGDQQTVIIIACFIKVGPLFNCPGNFPEKTAESFIAAALFVYSV